MIDFDKINAAAISRYPGLLEKWLPGGRMVGREYTCGSLSGGPGDSMKVNTANGLWADFATEDRGGDPISLYAAVRNLGQVEAAKELANEFGIETEQATNRKTIVATYDYRDVGDALVFQTVRYHPKDFRQRRPDGRGGWTWDVKGIAPLIYRLPEVTKENEVFVVEGEKDVDALAKLGVVATCNAMGAGKWWDEHANYLRGKHVRIIPDNDAPGRQHAFTVALSLKGVATSIKILELPHLQPKGDVSDWIAAGGSQEELQCIVGVTREWDSGLFRADKWDRDAGGVESNGQKTIQVAIAGKHAAYGELPQTASRKPPMLTRDAIISRINAVEDPQGTGLEVLTVDILTDVANSDLPLSHVEQILKHIARTTKLSVTALRNDLKIMRKQLEIDGDDVRHDKVAISVIASFGDGNVIYTQSTFWVWDGRGKWRKIDDRIIKKRIHDVSKPLNLTKSVVDSIADLCKTEMFTEVHAFDQQREMINCINGELHYADGTYQLRPHCREHYATTQIPITFDQTAVAHRFERFLDEVFEFDDDKEMKKVLLLEALGYSLLATCQYEKFFMLIGQGANGKSVILYVLAAMVGRDHVAAVQPSQFSNKFQRSHLQGKLANLISELAANEVLADAEMKAIASGELMTAEHKFKAPFEFNVYATCWFATNYLPQTRDRSDALLRRAIILPFNRVFKEHEQDRHLKNALIDELPGILNLALKALAGVHARGAFTCAPSVELTKERWRSTTNHVPDFVEDCCELLTECSVESGKLYSAYKSWCSARSISLIGQQQLTLQLQRLGIALRKGTNGARLLQGIGLILDTAAGSENNESSTGGGREGREGTGGAGGVGGAPSRHNPQDAQHELFPGATGINVPEE